MEKADALSNDLQANYTELDLPNLFTILDQEARTEFSQYLSGIEAYRAAAHHRDIEDMPVIWREGNTCLHDYKGLLSSPSEHPPILLVPSLINRSYILDLQEENSFIRYLTSQGYSCHLVNWNGPDETEKHFNLENYIQRLARICEFIVQQTGQKLIVIGYCMGGTLATGLTAAYPNLVHALIALATPWDFEADGGQQKAMLAPAFPMMKQQIDAFGQLPTETLQLCFGLLDPMMSLKKFVKFSTFTQNTTRAKNFVALEDWLNDGAPLAGPTAQECLYGWYQENTPAKGNWLVNNHPVQPQHISSPSLCIIPTTDRIVPPESAQKLADILPLSVTLKPALGHIGMMSGSRAKQMVWEPVVQFLEALPKQVS